MWWDDRLLLAEFSAGDAGHQALVQHCDSDVWFSEELKPHKNERGGVSIAKRLSAIVPERSVNGTGPETKYSIAERLDPVDDKFSLFLRLRSKDPLPGGNERVALWSIHQAENSVLGV